MKLVRYIGIGLVLAMLLSGCTEENKPVNQTISHDVVAPPPPPLDEYEKMAIDFVEAAYIRHDLQKATSMVKKDSAQINLDTLLDNTLKPGKIKIASEIEQGGFRTVYLFLPFPINNENVSVMQVSFLEINGQYLVVDHGFEMHVSVYRDFEEFQMSQYWEEKGRRYKWVDAELR